jgi:Holliday junction resolvasome RuvABC ATP-dependent DNA helicase subunit
LGKNRKEPLEHLLLRSSRLGKTTLANIIANEMGEASTTSGDQRLEICLPSFNNDVILLMKSTV